MRMMFSTPPVLYFFIFIFMFLFLFSVLCVSIKQILIKRQCQNKIHNINRSAGRVQVSTAVKNKQIVKILK